MDEPRMSTTGVLSLGAICFLSYNACYAGRSILSAIMPEMMKETGFSSATLGLWGSMFFFTYGIGQVINGLIGDRIKAKWMVSAGLLFSGIVIVLSSCTGSSIIGTMVAYLIASATSAQHRWKWSFYITGIILVLTAILWFVVLHIWEQKKHLRAIHSAAAPVQGIIPLLSLLRRHQLFPIRCV